MSFFESIRDWVQGHQTMLVWVGWISMAVAFLTLAVVFYMIVRLPTNYFTHYREYKKAKSLKRAAHPWRQRLGPPIRIFFGVLLILVGFVLLFMPGQGVLTIVFGLVLLELSVWDRVLLRTVARPKVMNGLNRIRHRFKKPGFDRPDPPSKHD